MTERRIYIGDIQKANHCVSGARQWFRSHGLDFRAFLRDGIDAQTLLDTGDPLAVRVVSRAEADDHG